jgi:hypothetical protein
LAPLPTAGDAQKAQKALVYDPDSCAGFLPRLLTSVHGTTRKPLGGATIFDSYVRCNYRGYEAPTRGESLR